MANLITAAEFVEFRKISKKFSEEKIDESIELAEQSDFQDSLGGFYFDVVKNSGESSYAELMNGSEFEYESESWTHKGLKAFLADLALARYLLTINVNLTSFGATVKLTPDSEPVDRNTIRDMIKQAQQDASIKFSIIRKYILSKPDLFKRYCKGEKTETSSFGIRISKL